MSLTLYIEDRDMLEKLQRYSSSEAEQEQVALLALRLGLERMSVMCTKSDKRELRETGAEVLTQIQGAVESAPITNVKICLSNSHWNNLTQR